MKRILLALVLFVTAMTSRAEVTDYNSWMAGLDDNAFICQLSIPGAHDACSSSFSGLLAAIYASASQTQSKSVEAMLPLGLRLFDLRPCVSGSKLHINHGIASTSFDFDPVMLQICTFLDNNPSEFCIVVIRHESEGDNNNSKFGDMLQTSLAKIKDHLVDFRPNLTVGEARGKILFISRDEYTAPIYGGRTVDLADNRSNINDMLGGHCYGPQTYRCSWWLQDHYEISDEAVKKQAITDMLTKSIALRGKYDYTWVVNQTSGYKGSTSSATAYKNNAKSSNRHLQDLLLSGNYKGPAGLIFMDYAGDDGNSMCGLSLTQAIINHNFTYTPSKQGDQIKDASGNPYVAPRGRDMMWTAKYIRKEGPSQPEGEDGNAASQLDAVTPPASNWYDFDFDDSSWDSMQFPIASAGTGAPYFHEWTGTYNTMWIRREFNLTYDEYMLGSLVFSTYHDDDYCVYINGELLDSQEGWSTDFNNYRTVNIAASKLRIGRNVLAIQVQQNWGGAYFDCGVLKKSKNSIPIHISNTDWHTFVAPSKNVKVNANCEAFKIVNIINGTTAYFATEPVTIIPAGEAVLIRSSKAGDYNFTATTSAADDCSDNKLLGTTEDMTVSRSSTIFAISAPEGKPVGFYPLKRNAILEAGNAYLDLSELSPKPTSVLFYDQETANVETIETTIDNNAPLYNLAGQRIATPLPGQIYIQQGKKVVRF